MSWGGRTPGTWVGDRRLQRWLVFESAVVGDGVPECGRVGAVGGADYFGRADAPSAVGAHVSTVPYKVMSKLLKHPLTVSGNVDFLRDWSTVPDTDIVGQVERFLASR